MLRPPGLLGELVTSGGARVGPFVLAASKSTSVVLKSEFEDVELETEELGAAGGVRMAISARLFGFDCLGLESAFPKDLKVDMTGNPNMAPAIPTTAPVVFIFLLRSASTMSRKRFSNTCVLKAIVQKEMSTGLPSIIKRHVITCWPVDNWLMLIVLSPVAVKAEVAMKRLSQKLMLWLGLEEPQKMSEKTRPTTTK